MPSSSVPNEASEGASCVECGRPAVCTPSRYELGLKALEGLCAECAVLARLLAVTERLEAERGELSVLETEVARRTAAGETIARSIGEEFARSSTWPQRVADAVARIGGSWAFVIGAIATIGTWIAANALLGHGAFDPYPFILLNLVLSCLAALQAPIIMMSQNRASLRDRLQADQDFLVNLKAELEIGGLHSKLDHLLHARWENLMLVQQVQIDLLAQLMGTRTGDRAAAGKSVEAAFAAARESVERISREHVDAHETAGAGE